MGSRPPLAGVRVVELAGLAPVPYAGLLLADYGADVLRIDRPHPDAHSSSPSTAAPATPDTLTRNKRSIALDLKNPASLALLLSVLEKADVLIEPFRPGVLERLGLCPATVLLGNKRGDGFGVNPRLIVARLTGFRRDGRYARMAGHDINYLAVSGVLDRLGRRSGSGSSSIQKEKRGDEMEKGEEGGGGEEEVQQPPYAPANLLADFAGGGLMCALGVLLALLERQRTGKGQVVESAMVDGVASLASAIRLGRKGPMWSAPRGENLLDGGCPFYDVYPTRRDDDRDRGSGSQYVAVGALEPQFFAALVRGLGLDPRAEACLREQNRMQRTHWPRMRSLFAAAFAQRSRAEWEAVFDGTDACVTPVLAFEEMKQGGAGDDGSDEIRAPVRLSASPAVPYASREQGWDGTEGLGVGRGGEAALAEWMGWKRGRDYAVRGGALVKIEAAKL